MKLNEKGFNRTVLNEYNSLMEDLGLNHECISNGTDLYPDEDGTKDRWTLMDTVCETDYQLSTFYECGHMNHDLKDECPKLWQEYVTGLERYIKKYLPICKKLNIKASFGHCSQYD